jgi:hypothetical protein
MLLQHAINWLLLELSVKKLYASTRISYEDNLGLIASFLELSIKFQACLRENWKKSVASHVLENCSSFPSGTFQCQPLKSGV